MSYIEGMKTFFPPPNPWFCATTTPAAAAAGLPANVRVAVRQSRTGGWRVMTKRMQVVISEKMIGQYLVTEKPARVLPDQTAAEAHFQVLIRQSDAKVAS